MTLENITERMSAKLVFTAGIPDLLTLGTGVAKGYFDSQGVEFNSEITYHALTTLPFGISTIAGAYVGLLEGIGRHINYTESALKGSIFGLGIGAIEYGLGYCVGRTVGEISKN